MAARRLFLVLFLLFLSPHLFVVATDYRRLRRHHRHLLHQPFFPWNSFPPAEAPSAAPLSQPQLQQPKLPFSSISYSSPPKPFFPSYISSPPPPSPPSTALPTFPANISALLFPQPSSKPHHHVAAIVISVSLTSSVLIFLLGVFLYFRRNRQISVTAKASRTDNLRLYPPDIDTSDGVHKQRTTTSSSSKFLYLGTLANSREIDEEAADNPIEDGVRIVESASPPLKMGSPELKPLPPLPRHNFTKDYRKPEEDSDKHSGNDNEDDDDEEFFSPRGSSGGKESLSHKRLSSRILFPSMETDNFGRNSFNSSSNSASPTISVPNSPSPPSILSPTSLKSRSPDSIIRFPAPLRPLPSRPVPSSSPSLSSSSSPQRGPDNTKNSPPRDSNVSELEQQNGFKTDYQPTLPVKLPPPPPPPPPPMFWEIPASSPLPKESKPNLGPPVLTVPSRPIVSQSVAHIPPVELSHNIGIIDRNEETAKPKLKPLHWDKVRTSSDRAMVWDQIKSSSFQ